jgi:hypothetical protein
MHPSGACPPKNIYVCATVAVVGIGIDIGIDIGIGWYLSYHVFKNYYNAYTVKPFTNFSGRQRDQATKRPSVVIMVMMVVMVVIGGC